MGIRYEAPPKVKTPLSYATATSFGEAWRLRIPAANTEGEALQAEAIDRSIRSLLVIGCAIIARARSGKVELLPNGLVPPRHGDELRTREAVQRESAEALVTSVESTLGRLLCSTTLMTGINDKGLETLDSLQEPIEVRLGEHGYIRWSMEGVTSDTALARVGHFSAEYDERKNCCLTLEASARAVGVRIVGRFDGEMMMEVNR